MKWVDDIIDQLRRIMREPAAELSRTQRTLKWWVEFVTHCARELRHDRAGQMAAALSHYTLFSLLPMLVIMLIVLASFVSNDQEERFEATIVNWLLKPIAVDEGGAAPDGAPNERLEGGANTPGPAAGSNPTNGATPDVDGRDDPPANRADPEVERERFEDARDTLRQSVREIIDGLQRINFRSIGIVGLLIFIYASTELLATVERSFNTIYGVSRSRPFYLRLPLYYTVITLGPLVIIAGQVGQQQFIDMLQQRNWLAWLAGPMTVLTPLISAWVVLSLVYMLLPNTRVRPQAAVSGAFTAAVLWVITIQALTLYVSKGVIASIYGALALLPLFLLWLWLTWLIVLFGLEVTFTLQSMRGRRFKHLRWRQAGELVLDASWLVPLVAEIARAFRSGRSVTAEQLGRAMQLPQRAVHRLIDPLESHGLVHRVGDGSDDKAATFALARPAAQITIGQVLHIGQQLQPIQAEQRSNDPAWRMVRYLHRQWHHEADTMTLDELIDQSDASGQREAGSNDTDQTDPDPAADPTATGDSSESR